MITRCAFACSLLLLVGSTTALARADDDSPICRALEVGAVSLPEPNPAEVDAYSGTGEAWLTEDLRKRYPPKPDAPETAAVMRFQLQRVQSTLEASTAFKSANGILLRTRLLNELAIIDNALANLDATKPVALQKLKGLYGLARLSPTASAKATCKDTKYTTNSLFFQDASSPEQVVLGARAITLQGEPGLESEVAGPLIAFVSIAEASEFRAALQFVNALMSDSLLKAIERTSLRLTQINRKWSNYLEHGYSQYPWEAWINSCGTLSWDNPPATQWIVVHPELAVIMDGRRIKESSIAPALLLHALGLAFYGETRSWFLGLSATGAVTSNTGWGLGAGGTLHYGHTKLYSRVPHLSLSVIFFANENAKLGPYFGISADLWRLVSDSSEGLFQKLLPSPR